MLQIFKHGEKVREHIAAEGGTKAVTNVRALLSGLLLHTMLIIDSSHPDDCATDTADDQGFC